MMYDDVNQVVDELITAHLSGQEILRLKVTSNSMVPVIRCGDHVILKPASIKSLHPGDILVTRTEEGYLTHRLVKIATRGVLTKGDRNNQVDAFVDMRNIVGLVESIERGGRLHRLDSYFQVFLARILGWLAQMEINHHSPLIAWAPHITARVLTYIFY